VAETERAPGRCVCTDLVAVTERAALAAGRFLGSGDPEGARTAGEEGARTALDSLEIEGRVIIGGPPGSPVADDAVVGHGGPLYELAVDAVQGTSVVSRGGNGAISILAAAAPGCLRPVPPIYMKKLAVGAVAAGKVSLSAPVAETVQGVASAYGRRPADITALVLDRERHEDLVDELRRAGARIKLIPDGDITAAMSAAIRGTNNHLLIGIGGASEAVIAAAAVAPLGGDIQVQFWPRSRSDIRLIEEYGFEDAEAVLSTPDLVRGNAIVVATGISNGDLLHGVRYFDEGARTHSIVLCSHCNLVRFIDTTHDFTRGRRLQVRL
jgi:fructose-1,6-bisphosphatase II